MLQFPSEWIQHFGVNVVTAHPPDGGGRFRYHERIRPQPSFSAIINQMLAEDPEFRVHEVGEMLRLVTSEGEYGAWVKLEGQREGKHARHYVGAVFLGEFASVLDCMVVSPSKFDEFERRSLDLIHGATFGMTKRPRSFFYVPPVDWQGIPAGPIANWYPPDFPKNLTNIVVYPAMLLEVPESQAVEAALSQLGAGLSNTSSVRDELISSTGMKGICERLQGQRAGRAEPIYREMAIFIVAPYLYRMRLETTAAARLLELREIFRSVAGSFHPLPMNEELRLGRAFARVSDYFDHWVS